MKLRTIRPDEFDLVAGWLSDERNARWLDFGGGRRSVDALSLKIMSQRNLHCLRVFTADDSDRAVGIVGLSNVDADFCTAEVWFVLGNKAYAKRDLTVRATTLLIGHGFRSLGLRSVFAWTLETNLGGRRILERMGFSFIGRRRRCHRTLGRLHDRLLFDLLAEEHSGYERTRSAPRREAPTAPADTVEVAGRATADRVSGGAREPG